MLDTINAISDLRRRPYWVTAAGLPWANGHRRNQDIYYFKHHQGVYAWHSPTDIHTPQRRPLLPA